MHCFNIILLALFTKILSAFRCCTEETGKYPLISDFSSWNLISFLVHAPTQWSPFVNVFLIICSSRVIYLFYQANIYFSMILSASFSGGNYIDIYILFKFGFIFCICSITFKFYFTTQTNQYIKWTLLYLCDLQSILQ